MLFFHTQKFPAALGELKKQVFKDINKVVYEHIMKEAAAEIRRVFGFNMVEVQKGGWCQLCPALVSRRAPCPGSWALRRMRWI